MTQCGILSSIQLLGLLHNLQLLDNWKTTEISILMNKGSMLLVLRRLVKKKIRFYYQPFPRVFLTSKLILKHFQAPFLAEPHGQGNLVTYRSEKAWFWRQRTPTRPSIRTYRSWGKGRGVPRRPDGGRRMPSFFGGKSHDHRRFWKRGFFKSLSFFSKTIVRQGRSF